MTMNKILKEYYNRFKDKPEDLAPLIKNIEHLAPFWGNQEVLEVLRVKDIIKLKEDYTVEYNILLKDGITYTSYIRFLWIVASIYENFDIDLILECIENLRGESDSMLKITPSALDIFIKIIRTLNKNIPDDLRLWLELYV